MSRLISSVLAAMAAFAIGFQSARVVRVSAPGQGDASEKAPDPATAPREAASPALDAATLEARVHTGDLSRDEPLRAEFRRLAAADPARALQLAKGLTKGKNEALAIAYAAMAKHDVEAAWREVVALGHSDKDGYRIARLFLQEMVAVDRMAAIRLIDAHPEADSFYINYELTRNAQPIAASWLPILNTVRRTVLRCHLVNFLSRDWPKEDLPGLLAIHTTIPPDQEVVMYGNSQFWGGKVLEYWIAEQPRRTAEMLAGLPAGKLREDAWTAFTWELARGAKPEVLQELLHSPHAAEVEAALPVVARRFSLDPARQAGLPGLLPEGESRWKVIEALAQDTAEDFDIGTAESFLNLLPPNRGGDVYRKLGEQWQNKLPDGAVSWVESLPEGSMERDWAEVGIASWMARRHPERAAQRVDAIRDTGTRIQAIRRVAQQWRFLDSAAVEAWLNQRPELTPIQRMEWSHRVLLR